MYLFFITLYLYTIWLVSDVQTLTSPSVLHFLLLLMNITNTLILLCLQVGSSCINGLSVVLLPLKLGLVKRLRCCKAHEDEAIIINPNLDVSVCCTVKKWGEKDILIVFSHYDHIKSIEGSSLDCAKGADLGQSLLWWDLWGKKVFPLQHYWWHTHGDDMSDLSVVQKPDRKAKTSLSSTTHRFYEPSACLELNATYWPLDMCLWLAPGSLRSSPLTPPLRWSPQNNQWFVTVLGTEAPPIAEPKIPSAPLSTPGHMGSLRTSWLQRIIGFRCLYLAC